MVQIIVLMPRLRVRRSIPFRDHRPLEPEHDLLFIEIELLGQHLYESLLGSSLQTHLSHDAFNEFLAWICFLLCFSFGNFHFCFGRFCLYRFCNLYWFYFWRFSFWYIWFGYRCFCHINFWRDHNRVFFDLDRCRRCRLNCHRSWRLNCCLLYTSDAADDLLCVDLGGRRSI